MRKIRYSLVCCALLSSLSADEIALEKGWNLVSFGTDLNISSLTNPNIKTIWSYKDSNWSAYSFDEDYNNLLQTNHILQLNTIESSSGVWIEAINSFNQTISTQITNDINITKGWNLIGSIEDTTSLKAIDPNAIYWKYDQKWFLGSNKSYNDISQFSTISKNEGIWIYSSSNNIYRENKQKKFLFWYWFY